MAKQSTWIAVVLVFFAGAPGALAGCDKLGSGKSESAKKAEDKDDDDEKDEPRAKKKKKKDADKADGEKPAAVQGSAPPATAAPPTAAPPPTATASPVEPAPEPAKPAADGRSAVPTQAEWNAVTKEVTVSGSGALNCETKMVREWLRVSCRDKNKTGGTPTGVSVTSGGGHGDDFTFASGGVASLVVRFVEGVSIDAVFTWTDDSRTLHIAWPRNTPEPVAKGVFDAGGAPGKPSRQNCRLNSDCPSGNFCMGDHRCHRAEEVQ